MTKLEFINKVFFQWFFVRLTKHMKKDKDGNYTIIEKFTIMGFIVPLTGWFSNYIFLGKRWNMSPKYLDHGLCLFLFLDVILVIISITNGSIFFAFAAVPFGVIALFISYSMIVISSTNLSQFYKNNGQ